MFRNILIATCLLLSVISCKKENNLAPFARKVYKKDWMTDLMSKYPDKEIHFSDLCLPGSHDAGMYILRKCTFGANSCNTQTQELDMFHQLGAGYRIFDVRPALVGGEIYAQHATDCGGLGCQGDFLKNIFQMTNEFLTEYNEVVILTFGHFCNISPNDTMFINLVNESLGDKIYRETDFSPNLYDWSLQKVLGKNPKNGKVILVFEEGFSNITENRAKGYFSNNIMIFTGGWSNKFIYSELKEDQLKRYSEYTPSSPQLFQFSYQMTPNEKMAISCALADQSGSVKTLSKQTNTDFPLIIDSLINNGGISANKIPNVFWLDYGDEWMIEIAQKISKIGIEK